jgi:hypothetical protein
MSKLLLYSPSFGLTTWPAMYLVCRSPHQYADGTMTELVSMLHKEEAGLTVDRSLEGAPADVQTFQIFMSGKARAYVSVVCVRAFCCAISGRCLANPKSAAYNIPPNRRKSACIYSICV